jgi:hypothetical protein
VLKMAFETVKRNIYYDPDRLQLSTGNRKDVESQSELDCLEPDHIGKNHYQDFEEFHLPIDRMHNSNLHDWGIARGLEVKGTIGGREVIINPGVAIDIDGQLISLSDTGHGDTGKNPPGGDHKEVPVPVKLSTEYSAGMKVYVTIQFSEILRSDQGAAGMKEQVPWVRLQPIESYISEKNNGSKSIILAVAVINDNGKLAELKAKDSDLPNCRRLIGESVEELRIQRSGNVDGTVQDIVSGKIGPGDGGGLKITVPDAKDSVLFAREDGEDFKSLEINGNVGIGTANSSAKLEVNGNIKGKANLVIDGNIGIGVANPVSILSVPNFRMDKSEASPNAGYIRFGDSTGWKFHIGRSREKVGGDFNTGTTGVLMTVQDSGNVGIGTINPSAKLEVNGDIKANASELGTLVVKGKVGIGTTDPDCALHVNGTKIKLGSEKEGQLLIAGENNFLFLEANGSNDTGTVSELTICGNSIRNIPTLKLSADNTFFGGSITVPGIINSNQNLLVQGNVGIGTTNPSARLEVDGDIKGKANLVIDGNIGIEAENPEGTLSMPYFIMDKSDASPNAGYIRFGDSTGWKFHIGRSREKVGGDLNTGTTGVLVTVQDSGDVGIGTTTPSAKLNVDPQGRGGIVIGNPNTSAGGYTSLTMEISQEMGGYASLNCLESSGSSGGDICLNPQGRNVGIGTTNPSAKLEVNGDLKAKNKKFSIDHPLRPDTHNLVHSTLEGPETAVFYRGEAQLLEGEKTILLPDYFEALTRKENRTVLLTPKFEENFGISMLAASEVRDGKFTVKVIDNNNSSQKFYWEVKAIRSDVEILEVEPAKAQVNSNVQ